MPTLNNNTPNPSSIDIDAEATKAPITMMRRNFMSLRVKLLLTFSLVFMLAFGATYYWFYTYASDLALSRIRTDLSNVVKTASEGVNREELVSLYKDGQPNAAGFSDDPRYERQLNWLNTVHTIDPRAWPYIYMKGEKPNEVIYVVDLWARYNQEKAGKFREHYISQGKISKGFDGFYLNAENTYTDTWGSWVSAYAPITNASGEVIAAIGVDYEAEYLGQVQDTIRSTVGIFAVAFCIILLIIVLVVSRVLTKPIIRLTDQAKLIGEGHYEQDLSDLARVSMPDEINVLSEVFQGMADKVYQREKTLIQQVEDLKIEIDESKRIKQVNEIVDSDFFQGLQAKARAMRDRTASIGNGNSNSPVNSVSVGNVSVNGK